MKRAVIIYIPVIHQGYIDFLNKYYDADVFILSRTFFKLFANNASDDEEKAEMNALERDLRAVSPDTMIKILSFISENARAQYVGRSIMVWYPNSDLAILSGYDEIVLPNEPVSHMFKKMSLQILIDHFGIKVNFEETFLRWTMPKSLSKFAVGEDETITLLELQQMGFMSFLEKAQEEAKKSPDWWRQIGAVLVKEGKQLLTAYNRHLPHYLETAFGSDPRSNFNAGEAIDCSVAGHAEATLISKAAGRGICTDGCDLFVTTFPCINCANLIASANIKRVFFVEGYSQTTSADTLRSAGVELVRVVKEED